MRDVPPLERLDSGSFLRWGLRARSLLQAEAARLDSLNVFPVPDGDTGTNLHLTLRAALDNVLSSWADAEPALSELLDDLARQCLLAARGNSGVILSQLVVGLAEAVAGVTPDGREARYDIGATELAQALRRAGNRAWESVSHPVEGTILTVARVAADVAEEVARRHGSLVDVTAAAVEGAQAALAATPAQLPALARAGVVDAGGAGLVVILGALLDVVLGREGASCLPHDIGGPVQGAGPGTLSPATASGGGRFEVVYRLDGCPDESAARLRARLDRVGDSVVVAGDARSRTVHVHTVDVNAAVEAGSAVGRPVGIRVERLVERGPEPAGLVDPCAGRGSPSTLGIVACACGPGLVQAFTAAGAVVVDDAPAARATPRAVLEAIRRTGAPVVVVLANDEDTVMAADAAARLAEADGTRVQIAAVLSPAQGIAALAVVDPHGDPDEGARAMCETAAAVRTGMVVVANRRARTDVGRCRPGDVLGVIGTETVLIGSDTAAAATQVITRMLADGGELVTLVGGQGQDGLVEDVAGRLAELVPGVEVSTFADGHPVYALLIGVE